MKVNFLTRQAIWLVIPVIVSVGFIPLAIANEVESLDRIRTTAEEFAATQLLDSNFTDIRIKASALDSRLTLGKCENDLETFTTGNSIRVGRTTIGVRCTGNKPWTLYVPITIDAQTEIVVTSRPILRGEVLSKDSLELKKVAASDLPLNYLDDTHKLDGMEAVRSLKAGVPLSLNAVKPRKLVRQGQQVVIVAIAGGIKVQMNGIALRSGTQGELIPVQNSSSGRNIEAEVLDGGTVRVNL